MISAYFAPAIAHASGTTHWAVCAKQVGGIYANGKCTETAPGGGWEAQLLPEGKETSVSAGESAFWARTTVAGVKMSIACNGFEVVNPELTNPKGGSNGVGFGRLRFRECGALGKLVGGCFLTTSSPKFVTMALTEGTLGVTGAVGGELLSYTLSECVWPELDGTYTLAGTIHAVGPWFEFNNATTATGLKINGVYPATAEGAMEMYTSSGEVVAH